jgi:hypothetical protein
MNNEWSAESYSNFCTNFATTIYDPLRHPEDITNMIEQAAGSFMTSNNRLKRYLLLDLKLTEKEALIVFIDDMKKIIRELQIKTAQEADKAYRMKVREDFASRLKI